MSATVGRRADFTPSFRERVAEFGPLEECDAVALRFAGRLSSRSADELKCLDAAAAADFERWMRVAVSRPENPVADERERCLVALFRRFYDAMTLAEAQRLDYLGGLLLCDYPAIEDAIDVCIAALERSQRLAIGGRAVIGGRESRWAVCPTADGGFAAVHNGLARSAFRGAGAERNAHLYVDRMNRIQDTIRTPEDLGHFLNVQRWQRRLPLR